MARSQHSSYSCMPLRQMHHSSANAAAILRIEHLYGASAWAASAVPPLGALLAVRLAATCEASALPLPVAAWTCKRCESVLHPGVNCSLQIIKSSRKKHKLACADSVGTERTVHKCGYCGFHNVKVENAKTFRRCEKQMGTMTAISKDTITRDLFHKSPHLTPRASTKSPDCYSPMESPSSQLSGHNSTGRGTKRKRKGWLTLSQRTKQSNGPSPSPQIGRLRGLAGVAMMPKFESLEPLDVQLRNPVTADVMDVDLHSEIIQGPQSGAYDLQEENPSNLATVSSPPEALVVESTQINCEAAMNLHQIDACQTLPIYEAISDNGNICVSNSAEPNFVFCVPSKQNFDVGSGLQVEQHDYKVSPSDGARETQEILIIDSEISEKDNSAACHEGIEPFFDYESSGDLPEAIIADMPIVKEEKQMEENIQIEEVHFNSKDTNISETAKTSGIVAVDMDLEICDQNAIYSQNDSQFLLEDGPSCPPEVVKELHEVSDEVLSAIENGKLASEVKGSLMGVGVQGCFSLQEAEVPCKTLRCKDSLIGVGVQCYSSPEAVKVSRKSLNLARSYKRHHAHILSRIPKRLTRGSNKIGIASMLRRIRSLKRQLRVIPMLKQEISNLTAQIMHLKSSLETSTDSLAVERRASDFAEPSCHAGESQILEVSDVEVLPVRSRNFQKQQMEPQGGVEASLVRHSMKLGADGSSRHFVSDPVPTMVDSRTEQYLNFLTSPEVIKDLERTPPLKSLRADYCKQSASFRDNSVLDSKTPCLVYLSSGDVDDAKVLNISEFGPSKGLKTMCTKLESLKPSPMKLPISMAINSGHQIQKSKRKKVYFDNAIWNCLQARFPNFQPGESPKTQTFLYKLGRKWRIGTKWRKCLHQKNRNRSQNKFV